MSEPSTFKTAAAAAGIHRFRGALDQPHYAQAQHWREQAAALAPDAPAAIRHVLNDPAAPVGARLKAAFKILDHMSTSAPHPPENNFSMHNRAQSEPGPADSKSFMGSFRQISSVAPRTQHPKPASLATRLSGWPLFAMWG